MFSIGRSCCLLLDLVRGFNRRTRRDISRLKLAKLTIRRLQPALSIDLRRDCSKQKKRNCVDRATNIFVWNEWS
jgi:hypothetical protein